LAFATGKFQLTPIQQWYFTHNIVSDLNYFNQSFTLNLGSVDVAVLRASIAELCRQHSAFRIYFTQVDGTWEGDYLEQAHPAIDYIDLSGSADPQQQFIESCNHAQRAINIAKQQLYKFILFKFVGGYKLFVVLHHLIVDTVSWRIIRSDLLTIYTNSGTDKTTPERLEINSFMQWSDALTRYAAEKSTVSKVEYWSRNLVVPKPHFRHDLAVPVSFNVKLSETVTNCLLKTLPATLGVNVEAVLLHGLTIALRQLQIRDSILINLERHGRNVEINSADITNTIGWFTTVAPVYFTIVDHDSRLVDGLRQTDHELKLCPDYGLPYAACRYMGKDPLLTANLASKFGEIAFNYMGYFSGSQEGEWGFEMHTQILNAADNLKLSEKLMINAMVTDAELLIRIDATTAQAAELARHLTAAYQALSQAYAAGQLTIVEPETFANGFTPVEVLNKFARINNLVMVHPGSSGSESYINNICRKLKPDYRLLLLDHYILRSGKVNVDNAKEFNLEIFARKYISFIKEQQPLGPYNLFGWSFGGTLAVEIMRQLQENGDQVENLFLLDPSINLKQIMEEIGDSRLLKSISEYLIDYHLEQLNNANTNVYLFKALHELPENIGTREYRDLVGYIVKYLPMNNFDRIITSPEHFQTLNLECHHDNILDEEPITEIAQTINRVLGHRGK
jgi:thioesterase domain-containing protein